MHSEKQIGFSKFVYFIVYHIIMVMVENCLQEAPFCGTTDT